MYIIPFNHAHHLRMKLPNNCEVKSTFYLKLSITVGTLSMKRYWQTSTNGHLYTVADPLRERFERIVNFRFFSERNTLTNTVSVYT